MKQVILPLEMLICYRKYEGTTKAILNRSCMPNQSYLTYSILNVSFHLS